MIGWIAMGLVVFGITLGATEALRRYALQRELLDIPNARSSHSLPTPRGGGLSVVVCLLLVLPLLVGQGALSWQQGLAFWGTGFAVALVGWLDDHGHVAARWRLLVHFAAAGWGLYWLGGMPDIAFGPWSLGSVWVWLPVWVLLVWLLNLYNFMDGTDGIAGIEAVTVCLSGALLAWWQLPEPQLALALLLSASVLGFLWWNFPPARIFMGDAGSGFIGIVLGLLAVAAAHQLPELFWAWLILLGAFIVDATVTLLGRLVRQEVVYEAHRSHAYQHLARRWNHKRVALLYGGINLVWLLPIAAWVTSGHLSGLLGLLLAYIPLVLLALWAGASRPS